MKRRVFANNGVFMRVAYFDCYSGISGDMVLGAFIDLGLSVKQLKTELAKLNISSFDLKVKKVKRGHIKVTKVDVISGSKKKFNDLESMLKVIEKSKLDVGSKAKIKEILINLAKAEAKVHKQSLNKVHFHQLGQIDTIIDIAGCVLAIKILGIEKIYASEVVIGTGSIKFADIVFPLPAPAALELLKNRRIKINPDISHETVTPTGAVLLSGLTEQVATMPSMSVEKIGYGAGTYESEYLPNSFRIIIGKIDEIDAADTIAVIETNIDDTLGLNFDLLFERLFKAGALDVFTCSIMMKKQRPGILLQIQAEDDHLDQIIKLVFEETSTIGVRINKVTRRKLNRKTLNLRTEYGIIVRVKIAISGEQVLNIAPEYDDCKSIAIKKSLPFKVVYERIKAQALKKFG
ncbi:MAG: nickel pincer cofactor biosynthesis protein LarC [Candidatus Omnitrophica bacterium]|nr:nickel pincer cofactor biosynthesis protein LarC [Candidatus Omnitrophota bacterium]